MLLLDVFETFGCYFAAFKRIKTVCRCFYWRGKKRTPQWVPRAVRMPMIFLGPKNSSLTKTRNVNILIDRLFIVFSSYSPIGFPTFLMFFHFYFVQNRVLQRFVETNNLTFASKYKNSSFAPLQTTYLIPVDPPTSPHVGPLTLQYALCDSNIMFSISLAFPPIQLTVVDHR